jgi:hypothetical protein
MAVIRALDLFDDYVNNKLPKAEGYIISSFFNINTAYSIYEIVSYSGVKTIYLNDSGLTFQTNGNKLHVLVEPASYPGKSVEPFVRPEREQIPLRFSELEIITAKNQSKLMIAREPIMSFSSFTILKPTGVNFALVFYRLPGLYASLTLFFEKTLNQEAGIPQADAKKGARKISEIVETSMNFRSDFA